MTDDITARIAEVLLKHYGKRHLASGKMLCQDEPPRRGSDWATSGLAHGVFDTWEEQTAHVAEEIVKELRFACDITTVEQLRALRADQNLMAGPLIKCFSVPSFGGVWEANDDGTWNDFDGDDHTPVEQVPLPALLIWHPAWVRADTEEQKKGTEK